MGLLEAWKFIPVIPKQCGSAISMRGWKGEYWLGDAMGTQETWRYMHPQNSIWFSLIRHDFQQHAVNDMFFCNHMESWTPRKILSREDPFFCTGPKTFSRRVMSPSAWAAFLSLYRTGVFGWALPASSVARTYASTPRSPKLNKNPSLLVREA
jgi:hypothetical protein